MSMNIYFKSNVGNLDVVQTPTQITYMLLTNIDGNISKKIGNDALYCLYQYKTYVKESINGVYSNEDDYNNQKDQINYNLSKIDNFIKYSDVESLVAYSI